ncbi:hypothetical protein FOZ63_020954 [Perkinsus olseni]|uniref:Potassium channel inwardly rectifying transmembrane domain-containing protein n=2 Tax=Perkinsus olseni TaxID=32597 RepID=A0A7J6SZD2_PEROL|nr:hypothetical protein FOZ63_020954 [Perkinsus olseni]
MQSTRPDVPRLRLTTPEPQQVYDTSLPLPADDNEFDDRGKVSGADRPVQPTRLEPRNERYRRRSSASRRSAGGAGSSSSHRLSMILSPADLGAFVEAVNETRRRSTIARKTYNELFSSATGKSIVSKRGVYNVDLRLSAAARLWLTWKFDLFPTLIRMSWQKLWFYCFCCYMLLIGVFATALSLSDPTMACVEEAHGWFDAFFFTVETMFTIGYGAMHPVCFSTHSWVTVMAISGVMCHTGLTGVVFAKFTLGNRHELSCAFSTVLYAIPCVEYHHYHHHHSHHHLHNHRLPDPFLSEDSSISDRSLRHQGGPRSESSYSVSSASVSLPDEESTVQLCFRLVNVFHRHFFGVNIRCFLVEHHPCKTDGWVCPSVEEISDISTSIPLEFMSLPVEVTVTVPYRRVDKRMGTSRRERSKVKPGRLTKRKERQGPHQAARQHFDLRESELLTEDHPEGDSTEFELVCTIEFTDATTGRVIGVRKSWNLHKVIWMPEGTERINWRNIVHRQGDSGCYDVDVNCLDKVYFHEKQPSSTAAAAEVTDDGSVTRVRVNEDRAMRNGSLLGPIMRAFPSLSASRTNSGISAEDATRPLLERLNAGEHG